MAASLGNSTFSSPTPTSTTCQKRKRAEFESQPLTPPLSASDPDRTRILSRAVNVLSTAATALSQVTFLYQSDHNAQDGLSRAVETITTTIETGGKLIICGVGKSGLVGRKIVATMKSLGVACSFMHAAEAIHGDLGDIRKVHKALQLLLPSEDGMLTHIRTMRYSSYRTPARPPNYSPSSRTFPRKRLSSL
jgi:hypothetical protein